MSIQSASLSSTCAGKSTPTGPCSNGLCICNIIWQYHASCKKYKPRCARGWCTVTYECHVCGRETRFDSLVRFDFNIRLQLWLWGCRVSGMASIHFRTHDDSVISQSHFHNRTEFWGGIYLVATSTKRLQPAAIQEQQFACSVFWGSLQKIRKSKGEEEGEIMASRPGSLNSYLQLRYAQRCQFLLHDNSALYCFYNLAEFDGNRPYL